MPLWCSGVVSRALVSCRGSSVVGGGADPVALPVQSAQNPKCRPPSVCLSVSLWCVCTCTVMHTRTRPAHDCTSFKALLRRVCSASGCLGPDQRGSLEESLRVHAGSRAPASSPRWPWAPRGSRSPEARRRTVEPKTQSRGTLVKREGGPEPSRRGLESR